MHFCSKLAVSACNTAYAIACNTCMLYICVQQLQAVAYLVWFLVVQGPACMHMCVQSLQAR